VQHRFIPLILLALLLLFQAQLWIGRGSVPNVQDLQQRLDEQRSKNAQAQLANDQLAAEVRDLREGLEMVEEKARSELGMVKPNEIFVQISRQP
jgi:cell division protein FtsB